MEAEFSEFDEKIESYTDEEVEIMLEDDDIINGAEQGFMQGYILAGKRISV